MNIFVLDNDPIKAAEMQCDKHAVKMALETAQLLCSIFEQGKAPYRRTHYNHPCAIWARESYNNYNWLIKHGYALCNEYSKRYNKKHKCYDIINWCEHNISKDMFCKVEQTPHPKCMPDECKVEDIVESYRKYYVTHKKQFAKWKFNKPDWWKE